MGSEVLVLALAVVKAGGNAMLINEDNSGGDWVSVEEAVGSGRAFMVGVKPSLAVFDLDTPELVEGGERLREWAEAEGLPTLLVESGRVGHRHLYVRSEYRDRVLGQALSFGISKDAHRHNKGVRPPLAPHRKGLSGALIAPETVQEALEVLGPGEHDDSRYRNLPAWLVSLISDGDTDGRYSGRSPMALAIASGLRRCGYGFTAFRAAMTNRGNRGGAKYFALLDGEGNENPDGFLVRVWEKSADQWSPEEIAAGIAVVRARVGSVAWSGRTGNTDRSVMLALCELGTTSATTAMAFGVRRIAEAANLGSDKTVRGALGRLVDAGWLIREKASDSGDADTFRFGPETGKVTALISSPHIDKRTMCGTDDHIGDDRVLMHPVFRNGSGLGKSRGRTWFVLNQMDNPATVKEIAEAVGGDRRTIDRHLNVLADHGLAVKTGNKWAATGDYHRLDELAIELGAIDRVVQQMESHERQRHGYRTALRLAKNPQSIPPVDADDSAEEDMRDWQEEQELLHHLGLPSELYP
ncbi:helix-turn-helix domain-containing protein [Nocardia panacis]|uniref:helix-turn-helix domain-containing protein n=1 Tax=Nocardia panacis TaxID=2340916 RepID=UPI0011C497A8|nr:hypothetical protein [Nocardia panacis]